MTVKIDRKVKSKAQYVADQRGISLAEYLTEVVRPAAERDFEKEAKR